MDDMNNGMSNDFNEEMPKKSHTFRTIFITLILGILIGGGLVGYLLIEVGNPFLKKEKTIESKKEKDTKEKVTLDKESYIVESLVNRMHDSTILTLEMGLYASKKTVADDLETDYVNYLAINEAKREIAGTNKELTTEVSDKALRTIFGENTSFVLPKEDFGECPKYVYNKEKDSYSESNGECKKDDNKSLQRTIIKAELKDKELTIYEAVAFLDNENKKVYTKVDANGELSGEIKNFDTDSFLIERDYNKTKKYKYTFTYDEDTANYVFESISLEK